MTLVDKNLVALFPGVADAGGLTIGNGHSMNRVCVLMVEDKYVVIAPTGRNREASGLIGVRLQVMVAVKEYNRNLMRTGFKRWGKVIIIDDGRLERRGR